MLSAAILGSATARAQEATAITTPAAIVATDICELHIWPADRFDAATTGAGSMLGAGFGALGALVGALADASTNADKDKASRTQIANALSSESQFDALASLDIATLLGLPPSTIVRHDTPLERKTINSIKTRRSGSTAACYSELIVGDISYIATTLYGRSLTTQFKLREFNSGSKIVREYKNPGSNGLKLFPPKEGEDIQAAVDDLVGAFKGDFIAFAKRKESWFCRRERRAKCER